MLKTLCFFFNSLVVVVNTMAVDKLVQNQKVKFVSSSKTFWEEMISQGSDEIFSLASREEPDFFLGYFLKPNILFGFLLLGNLLFPHSFVVLAYQFFQPEQLHYN